MTVIEKIKAEVERLYNDKSYSEDRWDMGYDCACEDMMSFLIDLEKSEKPMNQDGLEKAVVDYFEGYWPGMETAEQCNTDLHFTPPAIMRLARHFAQWGAEHLANSNDEVVINGHKVAYDKDKDAITMEEIPNDLEEAAHLFSESPEPLYSPGHRFHWDNDALFGKQIEVSFIAGAKWDRSQIMKDAVEGEIAKDNRGNNVVRTGVFNNGFEIGDKVLIIIVKED